MKPYITIQDTDDGKRIIEHASEDAAKEYGTKAIVDQADETPIYFARILGRIFPERVARVEGVCTTRTPNEGAPTP